MKRLLIGLLFAALWATHAAAVTICASVPFTFVNGTTANATQVNANFSTILNCFNTGVANSGANGNITSLSALTSLADSGPGSFGSIQNAGDYSSTGTGELQVPSGTTAQRSATPSTGMLRFNSTLGQYEAYAGTAWGSLGSLPQPGGRLTLTTATPVLTSTATSSTIFYTPYVSNLVPVWNGTGFVSATFTETSQLLSDTTLSPAAAVAASCYDMFEWVGIASPNTGKVLVTRGPVWTNCTTRGAGTTLVRTQGILVNNATITNGPAAGFGVYVGTIATDAGSAVVSWTLGGSANGGIAAFLDIWNEYNRVLAGTTVTDTTSYVVPGIGPRQAHNVTTNQVTWVSGVKDDSATAIYDANGSSGTAAATFINGIGLDSTTVNSGSTGGNNSNIAGVSTVAISYTSHYIVPPQAGQHFVAPLETTTGGSETLNSSGNNQFSFQFRM